MIWIDSITMSSAPTNQRAPHTPPSKQRAASALCFGMHFKWDKIRQGHLCTFDKSNHFANIVLKRPYPAFAVQIRLWISNFSLKNAETAQRNRKKISIFNLLLKMKARNRLDPSYWNQL